MFKWQWKHRHTASTITTRLAANPDLLPSPFSFLPSPFSPSPRLPHLQAIQPRPTHCSTPHRRRPVQGKALSSPPPLLSEKCGGWRGAGLCIFQQPSAPCRANDPAGPSPRVKPPRDSVGVRVCRQGHTHREASASLAVPRHHHHIGTRCIDDHRLLGGTRSMNGRPPGPPGAAAPAPFSRVRTQGLAGYNVAWSPFFPNRLAVASSANVCRGEVSKMAVAHTKDRHTDKR